MRLASSQSGPVTRNHQTIAENAIGLVCPREHQTSNVEMTLGGYCEEHVEASQVEERDCGLVAQSSTQWQGDVQHCCIEKRVRTQWIETHFLKDGEMNFTSPTMC